MKSSISGIKVIFLVLVLAAPFYILYLIYHYGITVPYWDQWELVPLLKKIYAGELAISDIFAQHNEHRIFFPRLIMLALAFLTDWNIMYELYTNLFLAGLTLFILYILLRQTFGKHDSVTPWLFIIFSFLVFSPAQCENWSWGWQIQFFLSIFGTVVAIWSVSRWPGQFKGIMVAVVAAVVASYSFNNGLLTWVVIGMLLLMQRERRWRHIVLWAAAFAVTAVLYYYGYTKPAHHPGLLTFMSHPYDFIRYILAYIGSPLGYGKKDISIIIGLLSVIILCVGTIHIKRSSNEEFSRLLPWLMLALYAFLSAAATGVGRVGFGVDQALSSRYITISTLFIISTIVITISWIYNYRRNNRELPIKLVVVVTSISTLLALSYVLSFSHGVKEFKHKKAEIENAKACLENEDLATDECLKNFHPVAQIVRERVKILKELGLQKEIEWQKIKRMQGGMIAIDSVNGQLYAQLQQVVIDLNKDKSLIINGWAVDDLKKNSGKRVYLVFRYNDEEIIIPTSRHYRPDVAKHFAEEGYKHSGWSATLNTDTFKKVCYTISVRILRADGKEYYELDGDKPICFETQ